MNKRTISFLAFAAIVAAGCIRLGIWQLDRLKQRRAHNAEVATKLVAPPMTIEQVMTDTGALRFRRAMASGTFDFAHEIALSSRTHNGSPGVDLITPLRTHASDSAVLVNRGWVYAPDGMTVDFGKWHEPDTATVTGYLEELPTAGAGGVTTTMGGRIVRRLQRDSLAGRFPYPIARYMLVQLSPSSGADSATPVRLTIPALDEGPHQAYAVQWFAFAIIALVGAGFVARDSGRAKRINRAGTRAKT
jgi:surfeit locus 1 family protein